MEGKNVGQQRDRKRESVCERETAHGGNAKITLVIKQAVGEIHLARSNVGLICEINKITEGH